MTEEEKQIRDSLLHVLRRFRPDVPYPDDSEVVLQEVALGLSPARKFTAKVKCRSGQPRVHYRLRLFAGDQARSRYNNEFTYWRRADQSGLDIFPRLVLCEDPEPLPILVYFDVGFSLRETVVPLAERVKDFCLEYILPSSGQEASGPSHVGASKLNSPAFERFLKASSSFFSKLTDFSLSQPTERMIPSEVMSDPGIEHLPSVLFSGADAEWSTIPLPVGDETCHALVITPSNEGITPKSALRLTPSDLAALRRGESPQVHKSYYGIPVTYLAQSASYAADRVVITLNAPNVGKIWIAIHRAIAAGLNVENVEAIVLHKDLLSHFVPIEVALEERRIPTAARLTGEELADICNSLNARGTKILCGIGHGDLHCHNVLCAQDRFVAVDLGPSSRTNLAADAARLELSIWQHLGSEGIGAIDAATTRRILDSIEREDERSSPPLERAVYAIVRTIRQSVGDVLAKVCSVSNDEWTTQHVLASATAAVEFQTYYLQRVGFPVPAALSAAMEYWCERARRLKDEPATVTRPNPRKLAAEPVCADESVGELWRICLAREWPKGGEGALDAEGRELFSGVIEQSPNVASLPLSPLGRDVRDLCLQGNSPFHDNSRHVIISAPTGAGKSFLSEMFLIRSAFLDDGPPSRKAIYIAPTKALAQEKFNDLYARLPSSHRRGVILSTGDDRLNDGRLSAGHYRIACTVYEKANMLLSRSLELLDSLQCVVVDELHMLDDLQRGPVLDVTLTKVLNARDRFRDRRPIDAPRLRVVALTTEGGVQKELREFLSALGPEDAIAPMVITSNNRPVPVSHELVLPGAERGSFESVPIQTIFNSSDRLLPSERRDQLNVEVHERNAVCRSRTDLQGKDRQTQEMANILDNLLVARVRERKAAGYRAVVFLPSISRVERAAKQFVKSAAACSNMDVHMEMMRMAEQADNARTARECAKLAKSGAFIHHSDIDVELRRFIEERFRMLPQPNTAEVIFCTETLSYGVNLAVDEVFLFGVEFLMADRSGLRVKEEALSACEFHNMAGRAGRLGRARRGSTLHDYRVFVIARPNCDAFRQVVRAYYSEDSRIDGHLFVSDDYRAQLRISAMNPLRRVVVSRAEKFSPSFVRSVIDVVRHIGFGARTADLRSGRYVTQSEIEEFITRTYCSAYLRVNMPSYLQVVPDALINVLHDVAGTGARPDGEAGLGFLESRERNGVSEFRVTELGDTFVDTATDVRAVRPLLKLLSELEKCWQRFHEDAPIPAELLLLAAASQRDILGKVYRTLPEYRHSAETYEPWTEDLVIRNRRNVDDEFQSTVFEWMGKNLINSRDFVIMLRDKLACWVDQSFDFADHDNSWPFDSHLTVDMIFRVANGLVAWVKGMPRDQVNRLLEKSVAQPHAESRFKGWYSFVDQLQYKVLFVAKVLASRKRAERVESLATQIERTRELFMMSQRVRFGCQTVTLPLAALRQRRDLKIPHDTKNSLVQSGITPAKILIQDRQALLGRIPSVQGRRIVSEAQLGHISELLEDYYDRMGKELRQQWVSHLVDATDEKRWVASVWRELTEAFRRAVSNFRQETAPLAVEQVICESMGGRTIVFRDFVTEMAEGDGQGDLNDDDLNKNIPANAVSLTASRESGGGICATISLGANSAVKVRFVFRQVRKDGMFSAAGEHWHSLAEFISDFGQEDHLVIIALPWVADVRPMLARDGRGKSAIERRRSTRRATCFASANSWALALTALARGGLGAESFAKLWSRLDRYEVHVQDVTSALKDDQRHAASIPDALWEALFAMREPCES